MKLRSLFCTLYACFYSIASAQFTLTTFSPNQYTGGNAAELDQMRTNLGIQGLIIEDFHDLSVSPGRLTISVTSGAVKNIISENGDSWGSTGSGFMGVSLYQATGAKLTISVQGGTRKFGLGFNALASGTQRPLTAIAINGGAPIAMNSTSLPAFQFHDGPRNGYLVIEAPVDGPLIQQVELSQVSESASFFIDYLAYGEGGSVVPANPTIAPAFVFKFQSALGVPYTIQGSLNLHDWTDDVTGITGDGKIMNFFFEQKMSRKYYRLKP